MMRYAIGFAAALTLAACAKEKAGTGSDSAASRPLPPDVQTAVAIRSGINAAPNKADSVLSAHGLTLAGFDSLMYRIAADSSMRAAFVSTR